MVKIISTVISLVCMLIVVLPTLLGIVRGANKSLFRLLTVFGCAVLAFLIASLITSSLVNFDIGFLNITINGEVAKTIPNAIELALKSADQNIAQIIADNPEVLTLILELSMAIIKLVVFVVLFWGLKWLLWPVWAIFAHIFFKNKKTVTTKAKTLPNNIVIPEKTEVVKVKKRAWLGAVFGFVMGVITLGFTLIPVAGISDTLIRLESATISEQENGESKGIISQQLGEDSSILYIYSDSVAGKVLSGIGINQISSAIAKSYASFTFNGKQVSALDEIVEVGKISSDAIELSKTDFNNLSQTQLDTLLPQIDNLQQKVLTSGIVQSLYDQLVPYFVTNILETEDYFIKLPDLKNNILNQALKDILVQIKTITATDISHDISLLINCLEEINSTKILEDALNDNISLDNVKTQLTTELGDSIVNNVFELKTTNKLVNILLCAGVEYGCNKLEVEYVEQDAEPTNDAIKQFVNDLVNNGIVVIQNMDIDKEIPVAYNNFENIGLVIDSLFASEIVSDETIENLFDYVTNKANNYIEDINTDIEVKNSIKLLISDIKNIPNFANDCKQLGLALNVYQVNEQKIKDGDLVSLAKLVDTITPTFLYKNNIDGILLEMTDMATGYVENNNVPMDTTELGNIINKVKNIESFETEVGIIKDLIDFIGPIVEEGQIEEEIKNETTLSNLGKLLDEVVANGSVVLDDNSCKTLIKSLIKEIELPQDFENIVIDQKPIKEVLLDNTNKIESYQTELVYVAKVMNYNDANTLTEIGEVLDGIKQSKLLDGIVVEVVKQQIDEKANDISDEDLKNIVISMKDNVQNIESYATEFSHLETVINLDFENSTLSEIGAKLDTVKNSVLIGSVLDDIVVWQIEENTTDINDSDLIAVIEKVKQNVPSVENYQTELKNIDEFATINENNLDLVNFGKMLDGFVESQLFANTTQDLLAYGLKKGKNGVDEIYHQIYEKLEQNAQNIIAENKVYEAELDYVNSFVNWTNNGELKTPENIEIYLSENILDDSDNSKSILIDNAVVEEIRKLANQI